MFYDHAIVKGIKKEDCHWEITAQLMPDEETKEAKVVTLDTRAVCVELSDMAQKIEKGKTIDKEVHIDIADLEMYKGPAKNKGWAEFAFVDKSRKES